MLEYIETIVDEMRGANRSAVFALLRSLEAEANAVLSHARTLSLGHGRPGMVAVRRSQWLGAHDALR
jgi:hypothetical protein